MKRNLPILDPTGELARIVAQAAEILVRNNYGLHEGADLLRSRMLVSTLTVNRGNMCQVARALKVHRNTASRIVEGLGLVETVRHIRANPASKASAWSKRKLAQSAQAPSGRPGAA